MDKTIIQNLEFFKTIMKGKIFDYFIKIASKDLF